MYYLCRRNFKIIVYPKNKHIHMPLSVTYQLFFASNLAFIVTHLYGWVLKWFYRPRAYREKFHELFPAQRAVGVIYLLQLLELPYLLQIGNADALLYANAFALLFFPPQMLVMCECYFFPGKGRGIELFGLRLLPLGGAKWALFIPTFLALLPLFLQALGLISLPEGWHQWAFVWVSVVFAGYFMQTLFMALKIGRAIQRVNEDTYADIDDFPVRFAQYIQWVPTIILVMLAINFYANDPWVKFARDIVFIGANVWFCIYTLNPWRKTVMSEYAMDDSNAENSDTTTRRLTDDRLDELAGRLEVLLTEEQIFTEQHITRDLLMQRLGTNANYIAEVIKRCGYASFYDMICQHRVRYAIALIHQQPDCRMSDIADRCGFSSPASMAKAFQSQGKAAPSTFRKSLSV